MKQSVFYRAIMLMVGLCLWSVELAANETLSLVQAESLALDNAPLVKAYQSKVEAYRARAIAADTLPDPKLKLGLMNFPTDTYKRDQEPMTQVQVGIQQMFPGGNSLEIKSRRMGFMADGEAAKAENEYRKIRQQVRETWLELLYWKQADHVIQKNRTLFKKLVDTTRSQYATGSHRQQDVVRAQLELGMLDDKRYKIQNKIDTTRARLSRLVGRDISHRAIEVSIPVLPDVKSRDEILQSLEDHPALQMQQAMLSASEQGVALARQSYKPAWMLDLTYGARDGNNPNGSPRADFASAMVMVDIPLFTGNRQDKYLVASQADRQSAIQTREEQKQHLTEMLDDGYATWTRLEERLRHYQNFLLPKSRENSRSSLHAYQSKRGDFTSLMRAQITELDTQLNGLRLHVDYVKAQAKLLYLSGEQS